MDRERQDTDTATTTERKQDKILDTPAGQGNTPLVDANNNGAVEITEETAADFLDWIGFSSHSSSWGLYNSWDWVHSRLWVGGIYYSREVILKVVNEGFTDIFDCRNERRAESEKLQETFAHYNINYYATGTHDDGMDKTREPWLYRAIPLIATALRNPQAKVIAHCAAGYNRGPSLGYAGLRTLGLTPSEAKFAITLNRDVGLAYAEDADFVIEILKERGYV